ncbi:hypothetical protein QOZ80_8AG0615690 [Eleusine coracana subsp. coracana]|nr:hypothetical protein QOZ80_8AG0615690 [Eleusine coracana subsp. coracana]
MAGKLGQLMTRLHLARSRSTASSAATRSDVPRGHMAVYVGEARKRFVIPTTCLSHPTFVTLLRRVEDEFGFDHRSRSTASASSPAGKIDVPKGHMAVYVGEARKRFVIPTMCLSHPTFLTLLKRVEDEFGFDNRCGELTIPCAFEGDFANIVSSMDVYHHH